MTMKNEKIYEKLTARIIDAMENENLAPWQMPWIRSASHPRNAYTGRKYSGFNILALAFTAMLDGYEHNGWLTYKQAAGLDGHVMKGQKGTPVIFWKQIENKDKITGEVTDSFWLCRYFTLFNIDQIAWENDEMPALIKKNIELDESAAGIDPDQIEEILNPDLPVHYKGQSAFYNPNEDEITLPPRDRFKTAEAYFAVKCHECAHATGHKSRLARKLTPSFESEKYSKEELTAEIATAFTAGRLGIEIDFDNSAAYLKGWLSKIKEEPGLIIQAAGRAEKAANYMIEHWTT